MFKSHIQLVRSLEAKKGREAEGLFVGEGPKVVSELAKRFVPRMVFATRAWVSGCRRAMSIEIVRLLKAELIEVSDDELRRISFLQHPQQVLCLFELPNPASLNAQRQTLNATINAGGLHLALDGVQDPGNVGTIIRVADWFGIDNIFCSLNTADAFSPKVVQATMGSLARVSINYIDLPELFASLDPSVNVYGTLLDGADIYSEELTADGVIVMGNEGRGISDAVRNSVNRRLLIPNFRKEGGAESLNVAIATAVVCAEFRRRDPSNLPSGGGF